MDRASRVALLACPTLLATCLAALFAAAPAPARAIATLAAVRQITAPASTRLIIQLSEPVQFHLQRVPARPDLGVPARLYVDLPGVHLAAAALAGVELREGPVLRVRATQPSAASTR